LPAARSTTRRTQHHKNEHRKGKPRAHDYPVCPVEVRVHVKIVTDRSWSPDTNRVISINNARPRDHQPFGREAEQSAI
jgi:hypothetical protein